MNCGDYERERSEKDVCYLECDSRLASSTRTTDESHTETLESRHTYNDLSDSQIYQASTSSHSPKMRQTYESVPKSQVNGIGSNPQIGSSAQDICQTSQVSSSSSSYRKSDGLENHDTSWDINDPDIPARIDQYVSQNMKKYD